MQIQMLQKKRLLGVKKTEKRRKWDWKGTKAKKTGGNLQISRMFLVKWHRDKDERREERSSAKHTHSQGK